MDGAVKKKRGGWCFVSREGKKGKVLVSINQHNICWTKAAVFLGSGWLVMAV